VIHAVAVVLEQQDAARQTATREAA
jgi:hypothetical protein